MFVFKKIILVICFALIVLSVAKGQGYDSFMKAKVAAVYKTTETNILLGLSNDFYNQWLGDTNQWLFLYYAAYSLVRIAFENKDGELINKHLDVAQKYMSSLEKTSVEKSEYLVLQALIYAMRITKPLKGMTYAPLSNECLDKAEKINPLNPRIYYIRGNNLFHTPKFFGGGVDKALPQFEKAKLLYKDFQLPGKYWPSWDENHNDIMIVKCKQFH
jgi:hypothetical protein